MKLLQLLALLTLVGCGSDESQLLAQDPIFNRYEQSFRDVAEAHGVVALPPVSIVFSDLTLRRPEGTVGLCFDSPRGRVVKVDPVAWSKYTETSRTTLIRHELGHCLLGRDHSDWGYMWPTILPDSYVNKNEVKLLKELFKR